MDSTIRRSERAGSLKPVFYFLYPKALTSRALQTPEDAFICKFTHPEFLFPAASLSALSLWATVPLPWTRYQTTRDSL